MEGAIGSRVRHLETIIVDLPLARPHRLSRATIRAQSYVIVRVHTEAGIIGTGDAVVPGGPWWGGEAVESIKVIIDKYCAPHVLGKDALHISDIMGAIERSVFGNPVAKASIEVALYDAIGRLLNVPISTFFGGQVRAGIPCMWALGTGESTSDIAEAQSKLDADLHYMFKIKVGFGDLASDLRRAVTTADEIGAFCSIDFNEALDFTLAGQHLPMLEGSGVQMIEQPIRRSDHTGMGKLADRLDIPILVDEGACSPEDVLEVVQKRAGDAISLKISKAGGLRHTKTMADLARVGGLAVFGGTALDSPIGVAASLQLFCTLPELRWGCELMSPLLLSDDLLVDPIRYEDGQVWIPQGAGTGVTIDEDKLKHYTRAH